MADGSVSFVIEADDKNAQKEIDRLAKKIKSIELDTAAKTGKKSRLEEELDSASRAADEAREKLKGLEAERERLNSMKSYTGAGAFPDAKPEDFMNLSGKIAENDAAIKAQEQVVKDLAANADKAANAVRKIGDSIADNNDKIKAAQSVQNDMAMSLAGIGDAGEEAGSRIAASMSQINSRIGKVEKRILGLARRVFVFTLVTRGLRAIRDNLWEGIKANEQASAAIASLKGALLTLAQPILQVVIPAFTFLVNVLAKVIAAVAALFSMLTGKSLQQSAEAAKAFNAESKAIAGTGKAAKEASKSLASFDELNQLSGSTADAGGGGGGGSGNIAPTFDFSEVDTGELDKILTLVELIGSALLAWRIGSALDMGLKQTMGLMLGIVSTIEFVKATADALVNGVTWETLGKQILWLTGAVAGFGIAFGPVGAGIASVVGGLTMLVTGFVDAAKNGWNLENALTAIAGILATGLGIGIITGSWIPLLIAGIAAVLLAFTIATGHGEELIDGIKQMLRGFLDFFAGVFTGDINRTVKGITGIFDGLKKSINAVIDGIRDTLLGLLDWIDEKTHGRLSGVIQFLKNLVFDSFEFVKSVIGSGIEGLKQIFTGLIQFLTGVFQGDWDAAWKGIVNVGIGLLNGLIGAVESAFGFIANSINNLLESINKVIASDAVKAAAEAIGINWQGITFRAQAPKFGRIPLLAQGAVIPPNREFLAVLGDQKSGTNIEAPLDTILAAFRQVMQEQGGGRGGKQTIVLQLDRRELGRAVVDTYNLESQRVGVKLGGA